MATVIRGVLNLPRDMTGSSDNPDRVSRPELLDAAGRRVLSLGPGANDLSQLPAGVYFVRSSATNGIQATHRVLLVR